MRKFALAASAASLTILALASAGPARAFTTVIGGRAGQCSQDAKQGRSNPEALDGCTMALNYEPLNQHDRAGTFVNRGAMETMNRSWEAAHSDFQAAIKMMPSLGEAHIGEGAYLVNQERWTEAEAELNHGIDLGSEELEKGYYFRAFARWGQDNYKGAYEDFQKALELKPGWSPAKEQLVKFKVQPAH